LIASAAATRYNRRAERPAVLFEEISDLRDFASARVPQSQDFDRILPRGTIVEVVVNSRQVETPDF
jgi:hypothetical protein